MASGWTKGGENLRTKNASKPAAIVHVVVAEIGAGVVASYPRVVVVVLLGKPLHVFYCFVSPKIDPNLN